MWHSPSYQKIARDSFNKIITFYEASDKTEADAEELIRFTQVSYKAIIVRKRIAKMLYRYFRKHNITTTTGLRENEAYLAH